MAEDVPGPPGAGDDGRIPRGIALPRLSPDAVLEVKPRKRAEEPTPPDAPLLVLELREPPAPNPVPRPRKWPRGPVIAAALVAVVVGLGLVVPGLIGGNNTETTGLPAPGQPTVAAVTEAPTPTPSATSKPKHTKKTVAHTPSKTTKTSSRGSGTTPAKGGTQTSSASSVAATTPKQVWGTTVVPANSALKVGQNWHTNRIKLSLTTAGDAVLTDENGKVTWSAGKTGGTALAFQGDGNLVLYQDGTVLWATKTMGNDGAKLVLQDDGNVTISRGGEFLWGAL